jgi:membrane protease YdiL (CAAX protease family)
MTTRDDVQRTGPKADELVIPQYGLPKILLMYAWPVVWFMFLIYVIGPTFVRPDGTYQLWGYNLIGVLGNGAELIAALVIFRREGYRLTPKALRERINLRFPDKLWKWGASVGTFVVAVGLVMLAVPLETKIATVLPPPGWMPDHPLHEVSTLQEPSPGTNSVANVLSWIVRVVVVGWIANYLGEGLYYRAALQPKLRDVFGKWSWVAGGVGFGLKHLYFWWRVPYLVPVGLALGFVYGPMGSLPLALFFHWLGNTL